MHCSKNFDKDLTGKWIRLETVVVVVDDVFVHRRRLDPSATVLVVYITDALTFSFVVDVDTLCLNPKSPTTHCCRWPLCFHLE